MITEILELSVMVYATAGDEELSPDVLEVTVDIDNDGSYDIIRYMIDGCRANMEGLYDWNPGLKRRIQTSIEHIILNYQQGEFNEYEPEYD